MVPTTEALVLELPGSVALLILPQTINATWLWHLVLHTQVAAAAITGI